MSTQLLTTKLYIPTVRRDMVARCRLLHLLDAGMAQSCKLTVICAPAGFGKTTLLSAWIESMHSKEADVVRPRCAHFAWVSLDEGDNQPLSFWSYFTVALQQIQPQIGVHILNALQALPAPPLEPVLITLLNGVTEALSANAALHYVVILDDYHHITTPTIHETITFLVEHLPPRLHIIIASRSDPPLPLSRLRAQGELTELRTADLRFSLAETQEFLNQVMQLSVSPDDVAALTTRTEGWIAGLRLAALALQNLADSAVSPRATAAIAEFTGSHRYVLDYLTDEVIRHLPTHIQQFLLYTSVVERFTGPLCDVLMACWAALPENQRERANHMHEPGNSQSILEYLEEQNIFITPLDSQRAWYRYHHLFADMLQRRLLQAMRSEQIRMLWHCASDWFAQQGLYADALKYALRAQDFDTAARLVAEQAQSMLMRGAVATVQEWLHALPPEVVHTHPRLCLDQAWVFYCTYQPEAIEPYLQRVAAALHHADDAESPTHSHLFGELLVLRAYLTRVRGDIEQAIALSIQAQQQIPAHDTFARGMNTYFLANALRNRGDTARAMDAYAECIDICKAGGQTLIVMIATHYLAELTTIHGHLHAAQRLLEDALQWVAAQALDQQPATGLLHIELGDILREQNRLVEAEHHLTAGLTLLELGFTIAAWLGYIRLARLKLAQGDVAGAQAAAQKAEQAKHDWHYPQKEADLAAHQVRIWLAQGDVVKATHWGQQIQPTIGDRLSYLREFELITFVRLEVARHKEAPAGPQFTIAMQLLDQLLEVATRAGRLGRAVEILVLQSMAQAYRNEIPQALTTAQRALSMAAPEGYMRIFIDEGPPMAALLRQVPPRATTADFVRTLLDAFPTHDPLATDANTASSPPHTTPEPLASAQRLPEPLSPREQEVLQLIATGLSNQEIARELTIAVSTVKTHINNIFGKLSVTNRMQATARARELHLLP